MKKVHLMPRLHECEHCGQEFDTEAFREHRDNDYSCDVFDPMYFEMKDDDYLHEGD